MPSSKNDFAQAVTAHRAGQFAVAENLYRRVLRHSPNDAQVLSMLGTLACETGRMEEGVAALQRAVRLNPREVATQFNLAQVLEHLGRLDEARQSYESIVKMAPQDGEARMHSARLHMRCGMLGRAVEHYRKVAQLHPDNAQVHNLLGIALHAAGGISESLAVFERAVFLDPQHAGLRINLANTLVDLNRAAHALPHFERAIAAQPHQADFHASHGMALGALGRQTEALKEFRAALALNPDHPDARFSVGLHALSLRDYAEGWRCYEYRWSRRAVPTPLREFPQPRWRGEPLQGKRLLIHTEQGIGDEIMFASIFPELLREAAHCVIECTLKLEGLFRKSFPTASIVATDRDQPEWFVSSVPQLAKANADFQIPAGSLPALRRFSAGDFPRHDGYLRADDTRVAHWRSRLESLGPGLKIGLSWRGGIARTNTLRRSLSLQQLLPLLQTPNVHFINLQYTKCAGELAELASTTGVVVHDWQDAIDDYAETAALVCALDLVVSVCTAVVHLCGALAVPVWVMAPSVPEWRYGRDGEDMPWYPSVRVFRQNQPDDWAPVIERVAGELSLRREAGQ